MAVTSRPTSRGGPTGRVETSVLAAIDRSLGQVVVLPFDWAVLDAVTGTRSRSQDVLHRLHRSGWLIQVRRGAYVVRPRSRALKVSFLELVAALSPPVHLVTAGRALSEAGLSDQSFRQAVVLVPSREKPWQWQGESVRYVTTLPTKIWGDRVRLIGRFQARIATPERAILDSLAKPSFGVTLAQATEAIDKAISRQDSFLISLARETARYRSPFVARRLGFIVEQLAGSAASQSFTALIGRSQRNIPLLPGAQNDGPINKKWRIRVNVPVEILLDHRSGS